MNLGLDPELVGRFFAQNVLCFALVVVMLVAHLVLRWLERKLKIDEGGPSLRLTMWICRSTLLYAGTFMFVTLVFYDLWKIVLPMLKEMFG